MQHYQVQLRGENYRIRINGKKELYGFYTTRYISANDPDTAELEAVRTIQEDNQLNETLLNRRWHPKPMIYLEEMYEIEEADIESKPGYAWFPMSDL